MAGLPANVSFGTITGKLITAEQLDTAEPDGAPMSGTIVFTPTVKSLRNPSATTVLVLKPISATLDGTGAFSTQLVATDDTDMTPVDWEYKVTFELGEADLDEFNISVPVGSTQDLTTLIPT